MQIRCLSKHAVDMLQYATDTSVSIMMSHGRVGGNQVLSSKRVSYTVYIMGSVDVKEKVVVCGTH